MTAAPLDDQALDQLFREARSYNAWLDRDVGDEQIHAIWELMKFGPTSANQLPARLVWCKSPEAKARLAAHAMDKNQPKITGAPVCVIVGMDLEFHEQLPWLFPHTDAKSWFLKDELRHANAFRNSSLQGACSGCPSSTATLKHGIAGLLKHYVPEVTEVRAA